MTDERSETRPVGLGRLTLLAVAIESIAVLVLVVIVAVLGPSDPAESQAYAERMGYWAGPVAGFVLCFGGGWLAARGLTEGHVVRGILLGAMVAAIDIAILVAGGAGFQVIFVLSNSGRLIAGALGGLMARSRAQLHGSVHAISYNEKPSNSGP